jgi:hypothetical protein
LLAEPARVRFGLYFDECALLVWDQAFYDHGRRLSQQPFFMSIHASYFQIPPEDCARCVAAEMDREPGAVAVIHADPADFDRFAQKCLGKPANDVPARYVACLHRHLTGSQRWAVVGKIDSPYYGRLLVFRKKSASPSEPQAVRR